MAKNPSTGLTDKQELFCREYLKDFNATAAYIRAGYCVQSDLVANAAASRLMARPDIKCFLSELRKEHKIEIKVNSLPRRRKSLFVYFIFDESSQSFKVGIAVNPKARLNSLQVGNSNELILFGQIAGGEDVESLLHKEFWPYHIRGEWFHLNLLTRQRVISIVNAGFYSGVMAHG